MRRRWTQREGTGRRCHHRRMRSVCASRSRIEVSRFRRTGNFLFFFFRPKVPWSMLFWKFQDMVFRTWFSRLGISTLGPGKFQDMVFKTWFSGLGISTLGLEFSHSRFPRLKPENFQDMISRCGISILGPGFHTGASHWPSATGTHQYPIC